MTATRAVLPLLDRPALSGSPRASVSGRDRRADYEEVMVDNLARDLSARFGLGFGRRNLFQMKAFYLAYPEIMLTLSAQLGATAP